MIEVVDTAVWEFLTGVSEIMDDVQGVHIDLAPEDSEMPYLVLTGFDGETLNRIQKPEHVILFIVKAVGQNRQQVVQIADLVRRHLHDAVLMVPPPYELVRVEHERAFRMTEVTDQNPFPQAGGVYRIELDEEI